MAKDVKIGFGTSPDPTKYNPEELAKTENMTEKHDRSWAVFTPATSKNYVQYASPTKFQAYCESNPGRRPSWMSEDGRELNFMRPDSKTFHYGAALYSAGHAILDIDKSNAREEFYSKRDRSITTVVGDSGGFQIGTGVLKFDWNDTKSVSADAVRMKILRWLENTADYSMMLDMPLWLLQSDKNSLKTPQQCLDITTTNAKFFIKNRVEGATQILNVMQGRSWEEVTDWWNGVKDFPFEGWGFGGKSLTNKYEIMFKQLLRMRDAKQLSAYKHWIHMLGTSRLSAGITLTAVQRALRATIDPKITISFDASSPYLSAANCQVYSGGTFTSQRMSYNLGEAPDDKDLVGSKVEFPFQSSPIAKMMRLGDLCVKGHDVDSNSSWDTLSYLMIMNINTYTHVQVLQTANRLLDMPQYMTKPWMPGIFYEFKEAVNEVFTSETPYDVIDKHAPIFNKVIGLDLDVNSLHTSGLFSFDDNDSPPDDLGAC